MITKDTFTAIAQDCDSADDFIRQVRQISGVPPEISDWFFQTYGENGSLNIKQASQNFINQQK